MIGDGVLNFTKEICDGIIEMASKNTKKLIVRSFNRKMDIMRVADYFPSYDDFKIQPTEIRILKDYTFYIWEF